MSSLIGQVVLPLRSDGWGWAGDPKHYLCVKKLGCDFLGNTNFIVFKSVAIGRTSRYWLEGEEGLSYVPGAFTPEGAAVIDEICDKLRALPASEKKVVVKGVPACSFLFLQDGADALGPTDEDRGYIRHWLENFFSNNTHKFTQIRVKKREQRAKGACCAAAVQLCSELFGLSVSALS